MPTPAELIDSVLEACAKVEDHDSIDAYHLVASVVAWLAAGSPKAAELEEEISRLNQDVDRPMVSERIGWINPEYHKKTVARLETERFMFENDLATARKELDSVESEIKRVSIRQFMDMENERDALRAENEKLKKALDPIEGMRVSPQEIRAAMDDVCRSPEYLNEAIVKTAALACAFSLAALRPEKV